jgi:hypothetical protein
VVNLAKAHLDTAVWAGGYLFHLLVVLQVVGQGIVGRSDIQNHAPQMVDVADAERTDLLSQPS